MATALSEVYDPRRNPALAMEPDAGYRPNAGETFMNSVQLAYFRRKLLDWKEAIVRESRDTMAQLKSGPIETKISRGKSADAASRRASSRDSLFLSATIRRVQDPAVDLTPVRVRNLSAIGLMADYLDVAIAGDPVVVTLRGIGAVSGKVAWVKSGRIGINFDVEVDPLKARKPVVRPAAPPIRRRPL